MTKQEMKKMIKEYVRYAIIAAKKCSASDSDVKRNILVQATGVVNFGHFNFVFNDEEYEKLINKLLF